MSSPIGLRIAEGHLGLLEVAALSSMFASVSVRNFCPFSKRDLCLARRDTRG